MITIAIGSDHRGFQQKQFIIDHCAKDGQYAFTDVGTHVSERTDYPIYAAKVIEAMLAGKASHGILLCANGIGMAIAANRHKHIYAGVVWNADVARTSKEDDNINLLVLPSDYITQAQIPSILSTWLTTKFKGGRYAERIAMLDR